MVPYKQRVQAYLTKSVDSLFRTIQFSNGVVRAMDKVVISDLKNVSDTAPADGDVLEWSAAQGKWVPGPGGGGVIPTLQQVMDQGAAYTGTNNFSMASAASYVTDQGFNLGLGNASGTLSSASVYAAQSLQHLSTGTSGTAELTLDANGSVDLNWKSGATTTGFTIDGTQMLVTDANNTKGLEYAAAYKTKFTLHSLVDKDYVDSSLPATGANDQVPYSNGSGFDFSNNFMFDGNYASIGHGSIDTNQILYVRNQINGKDTLKLYDGTNSGTTSIQLTNTGSTAAAFKRGIDMNVRNLSSGGTGVTGIELNVADSTTASTRTGFAWTGLYMDADWTTKDGYGAVIRTITANALKNTALYLEAANAGVGGHTALQIVDGTQQAGYLLTSDANGNANWQAPPSGGATDINGLSDATTPATDNIGLGSGALASITTGDYNTAVGINAGTALSTGTRNVFIGNDAGKAVTGKADCVAIGEGAMGVGTGGNTNIAVGANALTSVTGQGNIGIGNSAGFSITGGQYNICLGRNANALNTGSYQIAIGQGMTTTASNTFILGRVNQTLLHGEFGTQGQTKLGVNLGNTYTAPIANLEVRGNSSDATTALFTTEGGGTLFRVNYNGNVGIGVDPQQELHIKGNQAIIRLEAQASSGANYLEFWDPSERKGYIGYGSSSNDQLSIVNDEHGENVNLWTTNSGGTTVKGLEIDSNQDVTVSNGNLIVTGQAYSSTHTLTAGATVTPDFDNGNVQTVTLDQATTLGNPTNLKDGATYIVIVKQPAAANHTLAFGTAYKFEGGTAPTITAANGATDVLTFVSDGTNLYGAAALNFS